jgi:hypothetical protein
LIKSPDETLGILEPAGWIFGQTAKNDDFQVFGDAGPELRRGNHGISGVSDHGLDSIALVKRRPTGQKVVSDGAERVDITPRIQFPTAPGLLG